MFGQVADEGRRIIAYHFPFPGVGYVVREENGFRFVPTIWRKSVNDVAQSSVSEWLSGTAFMNW